MIDFHTHILPHMDDGSQSRAESVDLLRRLGAQGVDAVALTPHFYPQENELKEFLNRREIAFRYLSPLLTEDLPKVRLGAEVYYYEGISRQPDLPLLRLEGTDLLLLEMPMRPWSDLTLRELTDLSGRGGLRIVLAHVERYWASQKPGTWDQLTQRGILAQINAESLLRFSTRRRALNLLREGRVSFIGTDCHNLSDRRPRMNEALDVIRKKLGTAFLESFEEQNRARFGIGDPALHSST